MPTGSYSLFLGGTILVDIYLCVANLEQSSYIFCAVIHRASYTSVPTRVSNVLHKLKIVEYKIRRKGRTNMRNIIITGDHIMFKFIGS
jgi:hypothetical protein